MECAPPWAQRPDESDEAYARFLLYRNLGPGRSLQLAYRTYLKTFRNAVPDATKGNKKPQVPGHWGDDSARHKWGDRAAAWDIAQLERQGPELARLWAGILVAAATKAAQKLAEPGCQPKDFMQALAVVDRLAPYLTPDALKHLQPTPDGPGEPKSPPTKQRVK